MQYQRYTDIQGWTPEIDSDGKDVDPKYLSDMENIDLYNSYATPAIAPTANIYSPLITTELQSSGYALVGVATYLHSVRGKVRVYVLWKTNSLRVYVYEFNTDTVILVPFDNYGISTGTITYIAGQAPTKVNFSLVNNQLKINLNMLGSYLSLVGTPDIILNLTLLYLDSTKTFRTGVAYNSGWYLIPRWLGHSYDLVGFDTTASITSTDTRTSIIEDFADATYEAGITVVGGTIGGGSWTPTVPADHIEVSGLSNLWKLIIEIGLTAHESRTLRVEIRNASAEIVYSNEQFILNTLTGEIVLFPNAIGEGLTLKINFIDANASLNEASISTLSLYSFGVEKLVVIGKNSDGQRFLVKTPANSLGMFSDFTFFLAVSGIDWRIDSFEVYWKVEDLYVLAETVELTGWADAGSGVISKEIVFDESVALTTTLNFNYGLGEGISVNNQSNIYSEIFHKGRTYFTKETEKVYMSHLSGTGQVQPDSFPYDEEVQFGFFYLDVPESLIGLSVSQLDELCLHTAKNLFVYYIEASGSSIIRYYRQINGGTGISNANSITKGLGGKPVSEFNCWFDEDGIYAYGGGSQPPISLTRKTHYRYWKSLDKTNAFGFYVHSKREYWIVVEDIILIFEFDTAQFKKYRLPKQIKSYVEEVSGVLHYIDIDSNPQQIDLINGNTYLTSYVETHYSSNKLITERGYQVEVGEYQIKITNEMFVSLLEKVVPAKNLIISFSFDNVEDYITITLPSDRASYLLLMPVIPYGKVKMKITLPAVKIRLGEFGYSYIMTKQANGQLN